MYLPIILQSAIKSELALQDSTTLILYKSILFDKTRVANLDQRISAFQFFSNKLASSFSKGSILFLYYMEKQGPYYV